MTPNERAEIERAAHAAAAAAPPLTARQRNYLNTVLRDAMRTVRRRHEESPSAIPPTDHSASNPRE